MSFQDRVRERLIMDAIDKRGITSHHPAYAPLIAALTQLGGFDLPAGGSYTAIVSLHFRPIGPRSLARPDATLSHLQRALFHPPSNDSDHIYQIPTARFRQLINLHLDILNVPLRPTVIEPRLITPPPLTDSQRDARRRKDDEELGQFGFRSQTRPVRSRERDAWLNENSGNFGLLDFERPDIKW